MDLKVQLNILLKRNNKAIAGKIVKNWGMQVHHYHSSNI